MELLNVQDAEFQSEKFADPCTAIFNTSTLKVIKLEELAHYRQLLDSRK